MASILDVIDSFNTMGELYSDINKFEEEIVLIFQKEADETNKQIKKLSAEMKTSEREIMRNTIFFGQYFQKMGLNNKKNSELSVKLAARSLDMAEKYGITLETANDLLHDAMEGQPYALNLISNKSGQSLSTKKLNFNNKEVVVYGILEATEDTKGSYKGREISRENQNEKFEEIINNKFI